MSAPSFTTSTVHAHRLHGPQPHVSFNSQRSWHVHAGVYSWRNIPYVTAGNRSGPDAEPAHEKQQLDVYIPAAPFPRKPLPVALFVHGGAWQRGDRQSRLNTYGNVGIGCARAGIVGVVMSYRLAPEVRTRGDTRHRPCVAMSAYRARCASFGRLHC